MKKIAEEKQQSLLDKKRRAFVTKTAVIGVGVASAAVLPNVAVANTTELKTESKKQQKGYQLTDHVADYYQSASN
ncbi:MAG: hypothetical protein ACJAZT_000291 [Gammaproteobacteria bacterium]|jgi:hypothetical protein